jgi:hypothetical protein
MNKREIIGLIASRFGVMHDEDDPAFAFIGVQIMAIEEGERRIKAMTEAHEIRLQELMKAHEALLIEIRASINAKDPTTILDKALDQVREDVRRMADESENKVGLVVENGVKWTSDPTTKAQWWAAAAFCSLLLFALGFMLGASR